MDNKNNNLTFIKEVAKYFMNFLETDFHKTRLPKRNSISKIVKGYKVGLDLEKYKKLKKDFYTIFYGGFKKNTLSIKKGMYTSSISENIFKLIKSKVKNLDEELLNITFIEIEKNLKEIKKVNIKNYQLYLETSKDTIQTIFSRNFILQFLNSIEEPLKTLELVDENGLYQIEGELSDSLYSVFENIIIDILQLYFEYDDSIKILTLDIDEKSKKNNKAKSFNIIKELKNNILLDELTANIELFFKNISIADAFDDIYILFKNNKLIDKTELYLYMYEISAGKHTFPLFYIPIKLEEKKGSFDLIFDQRLYVNTKAIDYVVQEYNIGNTSSMGTLAGNFDRIIYINDDENFIEKVKWISNSIQNFFKFNKQLDGEDSKYQKLDNLLTSFSNKSYIYLFDKSDESVINDYEEILNDKEGILGQFSILLNDFIEHNPKNFEEEIENKWSEKNVSNKLIFESPIPLNDEQKQVIMALQNPDCKVVTLEGPPGTGKSHTITAIICRALLDSKSVLVLSDKKEALDVIEYKITETLNKVRKDDDFLNPILRLGKSGNKFGKIVQGQTINKIAEHYSAYKHKKGDLDKEKNNLLNIIGENINNNVSNYENISINDIKYFFKNVDKFSEINWYNSVEELEIDLLELKKSMEILNNLNITSSINYDLLEDKNYKIYEQYIKSLKELYELNNNFCNDNNINYKNLNTDDLLLFKDINYFKNRGKGLKKIKNSIELIEIFYSENKKLNDLLPLNKQNKYSYDNILDKLINIDILVEKGKKFLGENFNDLNFIGFFELEHFIKGETSGSFNKIIVNIIKLKKIIIGFLFNKKKLNQESKRLKLLFPYSDIEKLIKNIGNTEKVLDLFNFILLEIQNDSDKEIKEKWNLLIYILSNNIDYNALIKNIQNLGKYYKKFIFNDEEYKTEDLILDIDLKIKYNNWYKEIIDISKKIFNYSNSLNLNGFSDLDIYNFEIKTDFCDSFNGPEQFNDGAVMGLFNSYSKGTFEQFEEIIILRNYKKELDLFIVDSEYKSNLFIKLNIVQGLGGKEFGKEKFSSDLDNYDNEFIKEYIEFKNIEFKLMDQFNNTPDDIFSDGIQNIQEQTTAEMAYFLDKRIVEYTRNYANEVNTLKGIISKKKKFPKGLFKNLKNAFPCILAGIRDYSDYIPLEKDLFDLIIIDEASQVSIAQSLPALIRGKKIIILGDDKQFSNVKSNNASKIVNQEYKTSVKKTFIEERLDGKDDEYGWLENVGNFDIKYSILKFSQSVQNYKCQLKKHFRGYPEIISYSNKHFYNGSLQCMKIRGKPIEEVIKFKVIEHDGLIDTKKNTNELEINYIIKKILEFKEKGIVQSLGIITPHQHQAGLLMEKIDELPDKEWIKNKCRLKIMTFDSCQGEERDYIFYSMVATEEKDRLRYIFIKDLASINDEENGSVRAQRLNVGFSRAKECMHFVLSKPINNFTGEIKNALLHYQNELEAGKKVKLGGTDSNSPMEKKIQEYFYETRFYKDNNSMIEFIPQFDIGKYLKQLDKTYNHPAYKIDFLLIYKKQKIVIEYDGFKEHFENTESVDKYNYESYMKADDIYRQKVLEGYGYKFLRINKFNIGNNPVETLDLRLNDLFKKKTLVNEGLNNLYEQIDKLHDGDDRVCTSCNKIFKSQYFPYKTKTQCINCYEKENGKTLWTFRQRLRDYERNINIDSSELEENHFNNSSNKTEQCPYCYSRNIQRKGYRNNKKRLLCGNCGKNWSIIIL